MKKMKSFKVFKNNFFYVFPFVLKFVLLFTMTNKAFSVVRRFVLF